MFFCKIFFSKDMKIELCGHPLNRRPLGTPLDARAPNSFQDSLNESSVRPNGTPVMPILRSRKTQFLFSSFLLDFNAFLVSGKHQPEERKTAIGPIYIVFLLCPTQTSFSFPPAGTPEATSWEQGQMARPQINKVKILNRLENGPWPSQKMQLDWGTLENGFSGQLSKLSLIHI